MYSAIHFLDSFIPPHFHCIDRLWQLVSLALWLLCWPNQSGNIWCITHIPLLRAFRILDATIFSVNTIIKVTISVKPILVSEMLLGAQSSSLSTGFQLSLQIQWTFNNWVHTSGWSFADKAGSKGDSSDHLNTGAPSCWNSDQDAVTSSAMSEMYPTAVICFYWARDFFSVVHRF